MKKVTIYKRYKYKDKFIDVFDCFNTEVLAFFDKHNIPVSDFSKVEFVTMMQRRTK